jgi:chemotaxis protein histidine kinase CheA
MNQEKELENQMQFLEEAIHYLKTLESVLLEIQVNHRNTQQKINAALRAAHSIKRGASMMGFRSLSNLAHCLEDYLQALKTRKNGLEIDADLCSLLLSGVDWLYLIVKLHSEGYTVDEEWLAIFCYPVFEELHKRLGKPNSKDAMTLLSLTNQSPDIIPLLFQTEVNSYLHHLETVLINEELNKSLPSSQFPTLCTPASKPLLPTPYSSVRISVKQLEEINNLFGDFTIHRHSLKMQIERLQKLIRHLSNRVKNLERDNYELRLLFDKFTHQISPSKLTEYQVEHPTEDNKNYQTTDLEMDRYNEVHLLLQTVMETIVKIQEMTTDIQLGLEQTEQVNSLLNKTAQQLQNSLTEVWLKPADVVDKRL